MDYVFNLYFNAAISLALIEPWSEGKQRPSMRALPFGLFKTEASSCFGHSCSFWPVGELAPVRTATSGLRVKNSFSVHSNGLSQRSSTSIFFYHFFRLTMKRGKFLRFISDNSYYFKSKCFLKWESKDFSRFLNFSSLKRKSSDVFLWP